MDFMNSLDNALNKAKDVFDVACKKTGEVVTVQKQKFDISSLKNQCDKDFVSLGKIYFDLIKNNNEFDDETTRELVNSILEKQEKIDELNKEILDSKNKRVCPNCSSPIDVSAVYCSSCGEKVTIEND